MIHTYIADDVYSMRSIHDGGRPGLNSCPKLLPGDSLVLADLSRDQYVALFKAEFKEGKHSVNTGDIGCDATTFVNVPCNVLMLVIESNESVWTAESSEFLLCGFPYVYTFLFNDKGSSRTVTVTL